VHAGPDRLHRLSRKDWAAVAIAAAGSGWLLLLHVLVSRLAAHTDEPAVPGHVERLGATLLLAAAAAGGLALLHRITPGWRGTDAVRRTGTRGSWILFGLGLGVIANGTCPAILTMLGRGRIAVVPPLPVGLALSTLASYAISSIWEEIAFRRFMVGALRPLGPLAAVLISAALFASFHFLAEQPTWNRLAFLGALGVLLGMAYWFSGRLAFTIGIHGGLNVTHLALGGDPGFPAIWPFVTRMRGFEHTSFLLLGVLFAGILAAGLIRERPAEPQRGPILIG
jgi:membrane protease YdiL (CAAX protease family)